MKKSFLFIVLIFVFISKLFSLTPQTSQECPAIDYFAVFNSPTCWDSYKSDYYYGGNATVSTCSGNKVPVNMSEGTGSLVLTSTIPNAGAGDYWNLIFRIGNGTDINYLRMGTNPYLHLRLRWGQIATGADIKISLMDHDSIDGGTDHEAFILLSSYITPDLSWHDIYIPMSDFLANNPSLNLTRIDMIKMYGIGSYNTQSIVYIEKMRIVQSTVCLYTDIVKVNQLGYLPGMPKKAIVSYAVGSVTSAPVSFNLVDNISGATLFTGNLVLKTASAPNWNKTGDTVYHADFSNFNTAGIYRIEVPSIGESSFPFEIGCDVYNKPFRDTLRFFYYARSGQAIAEPQAEGHIRPAKFIADNNATYDYKAGNRDVQGGWFDAGDAHKDIHAQRQTMWFLLETLKQFKDKQSASSLNIPESDGSVNDIYYLIKWNLDFMKKMWNPDGSVQFWVDYSSAGFNQTNGLVAGVSTGSAAILAATFAKAYKLFRDEPSLSSYADDLLYKAMASWDWLMANPANYNPPKPGGGVYGYEYDNNQDAMARDFAAIEIFDATGNTFCNKYFTDNYSNVYTDYGGTNRSWAAIIQVMDHSIINLGYMDYINITYTAASITIQNDLKTAFTVQADWILDNMNNNTNYIIPIVADNHLYWGSSGMIAANAYMFDKVYQWSGNTAYRDAVVMSADWIGGRNPVNRCFISGEGTQDTDIYGFYWTDLKNNQPPGYMSGNINEYTDLQYYIENPWKRFLNWQDAATLEPGIYWNAEAAWLMGHFAKYCVPTPSYTVTPNATQSVTYTQTAIFSSTQTRTIINTPTLTNTNTATNTPTVTQTSTATSTPTLTKTSTGTNTPTIQTPTITFTPTITNTPSIVDEIIYPNPANPDKDINVNIILDTQADFIIFRLYSTSFRLIREIKWGAAPAGFYNAIIDKSYLKALSNGIYYYRLQINYKEKSPQMHKIQELLIIR